MVSGFTSYGAQLSSFSFICKFSTLLLLTINFYYFNGNRFVLSPRLGFMNSLCPTCSRGSDCLVLRCLRTGGKQWKVCSLSVCGPYVQGQIPLIKTRERYKQEWSVPWMLFTIPVTLCLFTLYFVKATHVCLKVILL